MAEQRYERVGTVHEQWYAKGAPVIVAAVVMLKDRYQQTLLTQMKFRNVSTDVITSLQVQVQPLDNKGRSLGEAVEHLYTELSVPRDGVFGQKQPVSLPDSAAQDVIVRVTKATFEDGHEWQADDAVWEEMPEPVPLQEIMPLAALEEYRSRYGSHACVQMTPVKDLWYCTCGTLCREEETVCRSCGASREVLGDVDMTASLTTQQKSEQPDPQRVKRPFPKWIIPVAIVTVLAVCMGIFWKPILYGVGSALLYMDEYTASSAVFGVLAEQGYADAQERVTDADVAYARTLLRLYDYDGAVAYLGEEHRDHLMDDTATAALFLTGDWYDENGSYYFSMDTEGGVRYNLPAQADAQGVYSIKDGYFQREDEEGHMISLWMFHVISGDEIQVENRNGQTYTLYRY